MMLFPQPPPRSLTQGSVLALTNITLEDAGEYVCKAENSEGQSSRSAWVEVLPGEVPRLLD